MNKKIYSWSLDIENRPTPTMLFVEIDREKICSARIGGGESHTDTFHKAYKASSSFARRLHKCGITTSTQLKENLNLVLKEAKRFATR